MNSEIMLDTAIIKDIEKGIHEFNIGGVTTNPTILKQSDSNDFIKTINEIIEVIGKERSLHIQVVSETASEMIKEAKFFKQSFDCNLYIKVPVTNEGLIAIKELKELGYKVTATGILTSMQILMAASCSADYAAPYVNRIETIGGNSKQVISEANELLKLHGYGTKILGASFKNPNQVKDAMLAGSESITASYQVLSASIYHPYTDWSINTFAEDFKNKYNANNFVDKYDL